MSELTVLDEKLAEVLGLAQAAQQATKKVATLARREKLTDLVAELQQMSEQAATTEQRCQRAADGRAGRKTAIAKKARETKLEVTGFMQTYLEGGDALDGLEFLSMAEAGELAHWEILDVLNRKDGTAAIAKAIEFGLPVQTRHVAAVREARLALAADEDPADAA